MGQVLLGGAECWAASSRDPPSLPCASGMSSACIRKYQPAHLLRLYGNPPLRTDISLFPEEGQLRWDRGCAWGEGGGGGGGGGGLPFHGPGPVPADARKGCPLPASPPHGACTVRPRGRPLYHARAEAASGAPPRNDETEDDPAGGGRLELCTYQPTCCVSCPSHSGCLTFPLPLRCNGKVM